MKRYLLFFLTAFIIISQAIGQNIQYQKLYFMSDYKPGIKNPHTNFYDIQSFSDGGFATLGFVTDTFNFSQGILTKYDCTGNPIWTKFLGPSGSPTNTNFGIVEADGGDVVFSFNLGTGFFQGSILAGRIGPNGQVKWMKKIGNNSEFGRDIVMTKDSGFVIAGSTAFYGTDRTAADLYIVKLDRDGKIQWTKTFGNPNTTYDEAYAIKSDSEGNLAICGRCIDEGTFKAFIAKLSPDGNPLGFKTFGYENQRTYCFDIEIDKEDNYLITGSTTILEENHQSSEYDVFLIKTDKNLNALFTNVYETSVGNDAGSIGEGLAVLSDGSYAIGVSTFAFTAHAASGPNAPNKNALYVINKDGSLKNAFIYNRKGSQYTRVRVSPIGGVILSGFSTAYASNVNFQGLVIKTNNDFLSGCNDIDVTQELTQYEPNWTIRDFVYQTKAGQQIIDYKNFKDSVLFSKTICETDFEIKPLFTGPKQVCDGSEVEFIDLSSGDPTATHSWIINGQNIDGAGNKKYVFSTPGIYKIVRLMQVGCIVRTFELTLEVSSYISQNIFAELCTGKSFLFNGKELVTPGIYTDTIRIAGSCDSIVTLNLTSNKYVHLGEIYDTIRCGENKSNYNINYNNGGNFNIEIKNIAGCDSITGILHVTAYKDAKISKNICSGTGFEFNNKVYSQEGEFIDTVKINGTCFEITQITITKTQVRTEPKFDTLFCGKAKLIDGINYIKEGTYNIQLKDTAGCLEADYNLVIASTICEDCLMVPNVFTPENGDDLNNIFRPVLAPDCKAKLTKIKFRVFNRWGKLVYESEDINLPGWNGRYENEPAPIETYLYQLNYDLEFGEGQGNLSNLKKKGSVSLIR
ncbi:MAG: gliding motility-associated C-terminal domain-containing protein [Saprospiraceae bacterium]|nr:gliding motility-associated C-terminal domain-containing protein [Candidatus Vicinibacter affinis]MBK9642508.1 gliding motility-associated C-terminal domain-containing protein [Candidatus Vicinibacter affinis]